MAAAVIAARSLLLTALLSLAISVLPAARCRRHVGDDPLQVERHERWMARFGRVYLKESEKGFRFKVFKENLEFVESFNRAGKAKHRLGLNAFSDLTAGEFEVMRNGYKPPPPGVVKTGFMYENVSDSDVPAAVDWRLQGAVTAVKNQGRCGGCWAFAAVAAVGGLTKITTGELVSLSEQQLMDCSSSNSGCGGGNMVRAYQDIISQGGGLAAEADYAYEQMTTGACRAAGHPAAATISGYELVPTLDEAAMLLAVAHQPVSILIFDGSMEFRSYSGGVFEGQCGEWHHAVTVVGYGTEDGADYWLVKNSWGESWGEQGFMKMARGLNMCGLARSPSYPTN